MSGFLDVSRRGFRQMMSHSEKHLFLALPISWKYFGLFDIHCGSLWYIQYHDWWTLIKSSLSSLNEYHKFHISFLWIYETVSTEAFWKFKFRRKFSMSKIVNVSSCRASFLLIAGVGGSVDKFWHISRQDEALIFGRSLIYSIWLETPTTICPQVRFLMKIDTIDLFNR